MIETATAAGPQLCMPRKALLGTSWRIRTSASSRGIVADRSLGGMVSHATRLLRECVFIRTAHQSRAAHRIAAGGIFAARRGDLKMCASEKCTWDPSKRWAASAIGLR